MGARSQHAGAVLSIDLGAIQENYRILRQRSGRAQCAAVLKANAYGLGADHVAPALSAAGCTQFFVAHLDEALALRPYLPETAQIYVLHGPPVGAEMEFVHHRLIPVLNSVTQIDGWRRTAATLNHSVRGILQVDTGMSRLGLGTAEVKELLANPDKLRGIELQYLMSHLACAEQTDHPMNHRQLSAFTALRKAFPACPASFANSSGIFLGPDYQFDLVRPGAALYGIAPVCGAANPMMPVVRLQGRIIQTRDIAAGTGVGYGISYHAQGPRAIATVAIGYADGWLRAFSNRGSVVIGDTTAPIVGKVSMDTCAIDVTGLSPALLQSGALVDFIGPHQPVDAVAAQADTIAYEILTSLGHRYHRQYIGAQVQTATISTYLPVKELSI
ncbi:alanine racemase [Noviherbaspirillum sp. Root189]|uniref:alanine racemase n=1 Tax=Noviherbaspirillum sp. Root189 TaxID=1736487 RepID=UPI00070FA156|nr:alanine racemase [Noviherbaspirillum sp. Root189]KRB90467.1 alanine racemase [Noviherbaspirillum sp. Root189]